MSDAIREAFELGKRFTAASNALDVVIMDQIERAFAALQSSQTAPAVPEAVHDLISGVRSINRANHHLVTVHGDDEPCYYQRAEWIQWILELADKAEAAGPQPYHFPDAGKVMRGEPVGGQEEVNQVADALLQAWKKAEPDHSITKHPISYIATFADMARAAIAATLSVSEEEIAAKAINQFKDELVKSVKPIFRPHIEGVCAVVLASLRASQQEGGE